MADVNYATSRPEPSPADGNRPAIDMEAQERILPLEDPNNSPLGVYAPFPFSPEPFANLSETAKGALMQLDSICTKVDVAARRMEVEQAWEADHFDRGYQHLLRGGQGGWIIPGTGTQSGQTNKNYNSGSIYDTNVYATKGDIIVAALAREVPKVEFFPSNPNYGPDNIAAEEANKFKDIWARNNNLHAILVQVARYFWTDDRVLLWTRYELDGQKYGFEEPNKTPLVPEDLFNPPDDNMTGQEGQEEILSQMTSTESSGRRPLGRETTTAHGKIDHKVPIAVDNINQMQFAQLYIDLDVSIVKATFPWIAEKVKAGSDGTSEVELDRIARENVRQAVLGSYVTGDSMQRHCVVKYSWLRPSLFMDSSVSDAARAELLEAFPNGCLLAKAAAEYAFARNESMDDHLVIGHALSGYGQNRRALGTALISIQKRINDWVDLLDDFFKRTVPKKWMNAEAFDVEALQKEPNTPGQIGPFEPQPGLTTRDQYMMIEDTPQPQTSLPEFIKWFITNLSEEISGALPSLFGAPTNTDTVGGIQIQRDQALQRIGCPWNNIQDMFAAAAQQAVKCAAECRDGKPINQNVPGKGNVQVNTANLVGGNVTCYPEANPAFPESWQQREEKLLKLIEFAVSSKELAALLYSPGNLTELKDGIRLRNFKVAGETSVTKQRNEFELLLRGSPQPNPKVEQLREVLTNSATSIQRMTAANKEVPNEVPGLMQSVQAQIQSLPPMVSTVPVAEDASENHSVEADTVFEWMNSPEGQKFKRGTPQQQAAYENIHLHWMEHTAMAKKLTPPAVPPKPPSESLSVDVSKMPPEVAVQALQKMNIMSTPDMFQNHAAQQVKEAVEKKAIPQALKTQ